MDHCEGGWVALWGGIVVPDVHFLLPTMVTWQGRCPTTGLLTSPFVVRSPPLCCPRSGLTILLFCRVPLTVVWFPSGVHPDAAGFSAVGIALGCVGCRVSLHIGWQVVCSVT